MDHESSLSFSNHIDKLARTSTSVTRHKSRLKKVGVAEAAQLENFGPKLKGKSFPFSFSHGLKLSYLISGMTSFQSTDMYQFREIQD